MQSAFGNVWQQLERIYNLPPQMMGVIATITLAPKVLAQHFRGSARSRSYFLQKIAGLPIREGKFGFAQKQAALYNSKSHGIGLVDYWDEDYPSVFRHAPSPPLFLFFRGDILILEQKLWGLVGTRRATAISFLACALFAQSRPAGEGIISGLALGVDAAAHWAALSSGRPNVAVLGCGIDRIYPWENRTLFTQMIEEPKDNLLISEFPLDTRPAQYLFPRRNRLIAAAACSVIVWESPRKSGAINTAKHAREFGHEPFVFIHPNQWSNQGGYGMLHRGEAHPLYPALWQPGRFVRPGRFYQKGVRLGLFLRSLDTHPIQNRGVSLTLDKKIHYLGGDSYLRVADNIIS